jgi:YVTN family beta-propeller protein
MPSNPRARAARLLPAAALFVLAAACGRSKTPPATADSTASAAGDTAAGAPGSKALLAYVTNEGSQDLTIIDTRTDSAIATIPVGTRPRGVKVTPDGKTGFVALSGSPSCPPSMPEDVCEKL